MPSNKMAKKQRMPRMDRSEEVEQLTRQMVTTAVKEWIEKNMGGERFPRDEVAVIVHNITACSCSTIETLIEGNVDLYCSLYEEVDEEADGDGDDDGGDDDGDDDGDD